MKHLNGSQSDRRGARARRAWIGLAAILCVHAVWGQPGPLVHNVETGKIQQIGLSQTLSFIGSIDAWKNMEISSKAQGQIVKFPVEEGDLVKKGELLFELDSRAEKIALARTEAELEKARAEFQKMNTGYQPEEIESARRNVQVAQSRLSAAKEDWDRIRPLAEEKVIPPTEATRARTAFEVAESVLSQMKARFELFEQGFRSEEVQIALAEVKVRRAAVDDIERRIEDHRIFAPVHGVIVRKIKEISEWANEGSPVLTMLTMDPMKLRIKVGQEHIASIYRGQKAQLTIDGLGEEVFEAEVTNIIPQAETDTRNFPVILRVKNPERKIASGMFARVTLTIGEEKRVLSAPREAVQYRGFRLVLYRVDPLPDGFEPSEGDMGEGGRPGPRAKKTFAPDAVAAEIEVVITDELKDDVVFKPKTPEQLGPQSEIVVHGASKLRDGALLHRLVAVDPSSGGASSAIP